MDHFFHSAAVAGSFPTATAGSAVAAVENADVAANSYHRYKEDVAAAKALKVCEPELLPFSPLVSCLVEVRWFGCKGRNNLETAIGSTEERKKWQ